MSRNTKPSEFRRRNSDYLKSTHRFAEKYTLARTKIKGNNPVHEKHEKHEKKQKTFVYESFRAFRVFRGEMPLKFFFVDSDVFLSSLPPHGHLPPQRHHRNHRQGKQQIRRIQRFTDSHMPFDSFVIADIFPRLQPD